ncbi:hypothetical protein H9P43_008865 [Blastocladiella emersonii ATCC 22665]|nr:hypothetical protein H9P43_008865 [Blastocladiella emersonii ATCC 22665]
MGKEGFLTAKAIGNRIKAKGLQKLRWYCEACKKSCRDENGFKCHINTESHQRAMELFSDNAAAMLTEYSRQFKSGYLDILRTRYGTLRVLANQVYQEYISDRHHVHMNATCWSSLSEFAKHLGREGDCRVDETERGWWVAYIDRSPEAMKRMEAAARKEREERDAETVEREMIEAQIARANKEAEERRARQEEEIKAKGLTTELKRPDSASAGDAAAPASDDASAPAAAPAAPLKLALGGVKLTAAAPAASGIKKFGFGAKPATATATTAAAPKKRSLASMMASAAPVASPAPASAAPVSATSKLDRAIEEERERKRRREESRSSGYGRGGGGYRK